MPGVFDVITTSEWVKYGIEGVIFLVGGAIVGILLWLIKKSISAFQTKTTQDQEAFRKALLQWQQAQDQALAERQKAQDERAKQQDEKYSKALETLLRGQSHVHSLEEENVSSKFASFVHLSLEKLIRDIGCSRAYFVIYHNGIWSNNGISLPKMSMINEAVGAYGIESVMPQLQSIPRGFLPSIDKTFMQEGRVFYRDIEKFRDADPMSYSWLISHGCKAFAMYPVRDVKKEYFIGFVGVEYYGPVPEDMTDRHIKIAASKTAEAIAAAACFTDEDEKLAAGAKTARRGPHD